MSDEHHADAIRLPHRGCGYLGDLCERSRAWSEPERFGGVRVQGEQVCKGGECRFVIYADDSPAIENDGGVFSLNTPRISGRYLSALALIVEAPCLLPVRRNATIPDAPGYLVENDGDSVATPQLEFASSKYRSVALASVTWLTIFNFSSGAAAVARKCLLRVNSHEDLQTRN